jgi:hypothetical protein
MNIPTAEEFFEQGGTYPELAIEFAKLHVQAALEEASQKAKITYEYWGNTGSEYCDESVDKDSILNSYPLTNIK